MILQFCKSETQHRSHQAKIKMLAGLYSLLKALGENLCSKLFQLLEVTLIPWLVSLFIFKASHGRSHPSHIALSLTLLHLFHGIQ